MIPVGLYSVCYNKGMEYKDFISMILHDAAAIANKNYGSVRGFTKGIDNNQVLTETDIAIGSLIVHKIKQIYPSYNVVDEEAGVIDNKSSYTWVVDPIDGTSNFANGIPLYGIMVGLLENGTSIAGGVVLPAFDEFYIALKGNGAYCNNQKISVTQEQNLLHTLVAYGIDGHQEEPKLTENECNVLKDIILQIRNLRVSNSCFDMMMVAKGAYGTYP